MRILVPYAPPGRAGGADAGPAERRRAHALYAMIIRRRPHPDPERQWETRQRSDDEFFPQLRRAPGFIACYLVAGDDGLTTAAIVWEYRAKAEAFQPTLDDWTTTLERLGNWPVSRTAGEVLAAVTPRP